MATTFVIIVNYWAGKVHCMSAIAMSIFKRRRESLKFGIRVSSVVIATSSPHHRHPAQCTSALHGIHRNVYQCSPRHPPHGVPVLTMTSTT